LDSTHTSLKSSPSSRPILFGTPKAPASSLSDPKYKNRPRKAFEENDGDSDGTQNSPSLKRRKRLASSSPTLPPSTLSSPVLPRATSEEQEMTDVIEVQGDPKAIDKKVSRPFRGHKPSWKKIENTLVEQNESS